MGYVFTPEEFEKGQIPKPQDYTTAALLVHRALSSMHSSGLVYGASINGSYFQSDAKPGSDIDVLVVLQHPEGEKALKRLHSYIKNSLFVPLEFVPLDIKHTMKGSHGINYYYYQYLKEFCREGVIGHDPMLVILPRESWLDPPKETRDGIVSKLEKLSKKRISASGYDKDHCDFLEKVLRQPIFTAIDMLRVKRGTYPSKNGKPLSKAECCDLYAHEFIRMDSSDLFLILDARNRYRRFLQDRKAKASDYRRLLGEMDRTYPSARRFMESNAELLSHDLPLTSA